MKNLKSLLSFTITIVFALTLSYFLRKNNNGQLIAVVLFLIILSILFIHIFLRKKLSAKNFFMSDWNVFTKKYKEEKHIELAPELLMEKFEEIIKNSKFKIITMKNDTNEILATTSTTLNSWGENMYIQFVKTEDGSLFKFESSTMFGMADWGKNERNYNKILTEFDESLTI